MNGDAHTEATTGAGSGSVEWFGSETVLKSELGTLFVSPSDSILGSDSLFVSESNPFEGADTIGGGPLRYFVAFPPYPSTTSPATPRIGMLGARGNPIPEGAPLDGIIIPVGVAHATAGALETAQTSEIDPIPEIAWRSQPDDADWGWVEAPVPKIDSAPEVEWEVARTAPEIHPGPEVVSGAVRSTWALVPPMPKEELPTQRMSTAICFVLGMGYP